MLVHSTAPSTFEILATGTYPAVCTQIIGVGMQAFEYAGEVKEVEKVYLRFEVPSERVTWKDSAGIEQEGPVILWTSYTASLHEKANLRRDLEGWRGKAFTTDELQAFELDNVLGAPCMISVVHKESNGRTFANIASISKLMKGIPAPVAEGELISFDPRNHSPEELAKLPGWLADKVKAGLQLAAEQQARAKVGIDYLKQNYQGFREETSVPEDDFQDSSIPF
jgi:hypothetical protein